MGLYEQPNDYTCGPFALKHALVTLGRLADEDSIYLVRQRSPRIRFRMLDLVSGGVGASSLPLQDGDLIVVE